MLERADRIARQAEYVAAQTGQLSCQQLAPSHLPFASAASLHILLLRCTLASNCVQLIAPTRSFPAPPPLT